MAKKTRTVEYYRLWDDRTWDTDLEQDIGPVRDPYNANTILVIPEDEPAGIRKASGP